MLIDWLIWSSAKIITIWFESCEELVSWIWLFKLVQFWKFVAGARHQELICPEKHAFNSVRICVRGVRSSIMLRDLTWHVTLRHVTKAVVGDSRFMGLIDSHQYVSYVWVVWRLFRCCFGLIGKIMARVVQLWLVYWSHIYVLKVVSNAFPL